MLGGLPPSTDGESEEAPDAPDDGNDSSSSNTRKELPESFSASLTSPPAIRRTKQLTRDKDEKASPDQKAAHYGELMTVMKESVSHLVRSSGTRDREWDSFFTWLNDFTLRMPRTNATIPTENCCLGDGIYPSRVSTSKHSEAKNRTRAAAAAYHVPTSKTSRSSRNNLHRPFAGTAVPAVPWGSEHTSSNGECIALIVLSDPN